MNRALMLFTLALLAGGCNKHADRQLTAGSAGSAVAADTAQAAPHPTGLTGPSVTPTITNAVTFFTPKDAPWWGEFAFPCYAAAVQLQPGNMASTPFTQLSPLLAPALAAADIDLDRDVTAMGMWGCGDGGVCAYAALTLRHPDKLPAMLAKLVPDAKPVQVGKDTYTIASAGAQGPRTLHFQAVPIAWPSALPSDAWSKDAARATHVLFITGLFGKSSEIDPLAAAADAKTAAARVHEVEGVVADTHGTCIRGLVGKRDFQPGFTLDHARFALALPEGAGDPLMQLVGAKRTLDLEVELALAPAPTSPVVDQWIAAARGWLADTMAPVRASLAAQGPVVDVMFDVARLIGTNGFHHDIKGNSLLLSWRTDRIAAADLVTVEAKLQATLKAAGISTTP